MAKVEVNRVEEEFNPITLTITIESRDELLNLFNRVRVSNGDLHSAMKEYVDVDTSDNIELSMGIYNKLYNYVVKDKHSED